MSPERQLRTWAWVAGNQRRVDELSGGRLACVWLLDKAGGGYSNFNRTYCAQQDRAGAVLDERNNGGGSAADYIIDVNGEWAVEGGGVAPEPVVSVFLRGLEQRGFLQRRPVLQLVDRHRLFQEWLSAANARPPHEIKARRRFGASPAIEVVKKRLAEGSKLRGDACLGLFSACREHGLDWVRGAPEYVLVRDLSDTALADFGLRPIRAGEAPEIVIRKPRFPESVFRAVPESGVSSSDGIQCWLDVRQHAARGAELATELWRAIEFDFPQP